ncbi:hypothetical protein Pan258_22160 [Symmachiella dynata]|nr:hypothetical protein Pan258_22160 [Symmachiella dynata]
MSHDKQKIPAKRQFLVPLIWLWNLNAVLFFLSLYGAAVRDNALCWIAAVVLFVFLLALSIYLTWQIAGIIFRNHERLREHRRSGKVRLSFHESLVTRVLVDGFQQTTLSLVRFTLHCILGWTLLLLFLVTVGAALKLDFRVFLEAGPKAVGLGVVIGCFVGILIELLGRTLLIAEGVSVSLNIPGTTTYTWPFNEIAGSRVIQVHSSRIVIEIDFTMCRRKLSSIRFVSRASASHFNDLRRILGDFESTTTEPRNRTNG